ncbi:hypothetical protein NMG60_11016165 [Bertholletia excelsa]
MGASSSSPQVPDEQREAESLAASTGALPMLQKAFSAMADPETKAIPVQTLQRCFCISLAQPVSEAINIPPDFGKLLLHVGPSIVDLFFLAEKGGVSWTEFLRGYVKCCDRLSSSTSFTMIFRVFTLASMHTGLPERLQFESDDADSKMSGFLKPVDALMFLWVCYVMTWNTKDTLSADGKEDLSLPDISHLVLSAVCFCTEVGGGFNLLDCDILNMDVQLPAGKLSMWALKTAPNLPDCLTQFVHRKIQRTIGSETRMEPSPSVSVSKIGEHNNNLLTEGSAWVISLTLRGTLSEEILKALFAGYGDGNDNLLYRSSLHGKGLNRFWSNIEGYNGPMLILIAAGLGAVQGDHGNARRWIVGALTHQPFENRESFYGNSGCLYAIIPVFNVMPSSGKEKNFVYSHLHPTGRVYEPHPKPVGVAFGGSLGNERIFIDEDFAKVTLRHHAHDKTYQPGFLFPDQGFLPTEALILDVEVWGLGGRTARKMQMSYKKREELFTEQRRKVDLKTFASWEDSPEKMMMDMISDPNAVRREDR